MAQTAFFKAILKIVLLLYDLSLQRKNMDREIADHRFKVRYLVRVGSLNVRLWVRIRLFYL